MRESSARVAGIKSSAIRRMLEASAGMENLIHFEQGEPDFATPEHIVEAGVAAAKNGFTHYTEVDGTMELREAIRQRLIEEKGVDMDAKTEVTVTSGSQEAMIIAALGFLSRGDEALILDPYYPAYFEDTLIAEATPVPVPVNEAEDYGVSVEALEERITDKTRMIWLSNPCNPTGHVLSKRELKGIAEVAQTHDLIVFADEIYAKLVYDDVEHISIGSLPGMEDRTITVNGFSKAYAMTGWRIGYVVAEKKLSATLRKLHYYVTLCPNAISQKAAVAALVGSQECVEQMLKEYSIRRKLVMKGLDKIGNMKYTVPKGAFYVFPDVSSIEKNDETLALRLLKEARVATVPGSGFGKAGEGHLRISYSVSRKQIEEGMERIQTFLEA